MKILVISAIILILLIPLSPAFGSWHWSSPYKICGTEVIKKGDKCDIRDDEESKTKPITTISISEESCKQGYMEIIKKTTNSLSCVKESSFEKLVNRGWGVSS
ncbi:hypothetical protein [Nitrosopumilus adriaticus]|uniref:Uncharacterized protein n=1 Tax=Nitrosopumilus adriaticus TaxID=1580092 RepID=A0A0D5C2U0_9ARCH|nr:hypothetical protein [Nitrosopumilus adriaticus]AJW71119.1 exported protein of unknown function [Nitrosopumilus adriaticus]